MRLYLCALIGLAACGPAVQSYKLRAAVGGSERVHIFHAWPSVGDNLAAGARNFDPPTHVLRTWENKAGWLTYTPARSCFGIVTHEPTSVAYGDGTGSEIHQTDFERAKYTLVTASGQNLTAEPPTVRTKPLYIRFESYNSGTSRYVPAREEWLRKDVEVCFATPRPLAEEQWVKWSYAVENIRNEFLFELDGEPGDTPVATEQTRQVTFKVDARVAGTIRKQKVSQRQAGAIVMQARGTNQIEATLKLPPHLASCVFHGTIDGDAVSVPPQPCSDAPQTKVSGQGMATSAKSLQLTMQVAGPDVALDLELEVSP